MALLYCIAKTTLKAGCDYTPQARGQAFRCRLWMNLQELPVCKLKRPDGSDILNQAPGAATAVPVVVGLINPELLCRLLLA